MCVCVCVGGGTMNVKKQGEVRMEGWEDGRRESEEEEKQNSATASEAHQTV